MERIVQARRVWNSEELRHQRGLLILASVIFLVVGLAFLRLIGTPFTVPTAIMAAALTVGGGLWGQVWQSDRQNKREVEAKLRERKSDVYERFIKFYMTNMMLPSQRERWSNQDTNPEELIQEANLLNEPMMLWASNDVIQSYADMRRDVLSRGKGASMVNAWDTMLQFEQMIFLMRADMGHDPKGFRSKDILAFFVNDMDQWERQAAAEKEARQR